MGYIFRDGSPAWLLCLLPLLTAADGGCARAKTPAPGDTTARSVAPSSASPPADLTLPQVPALPDVLALPDVIDGFAAGPITTGAGFVRRTYARGVAVLSVTLARLPMNPDEYASWTRTSAASFPQAVLDAPADDANGFYQCSETRPPRCALLIQLRSGVHLEIRGEGPSSRDDLDAVTRGLPLRALTEARFSP